MSSRPQSERTLLRSIHALVQEARSAELDARRGVARRRYEAALLRLRCAPDAGLASDLIRWIGRTYMDGGDPEAALDCLEAARAVAQSASDQAGEARAANCQAIVHFQTGQLDAAEELYRWALGRAISADDRQLVAMIRQNLGNVANVRGFSDKALQHYQAALDGYRDLGLTRYVGPVLNNLGRVHTDLRQWLQAEVFLDEAATICAESGDVDNRILAEVNRTRLWISREEFGRAREACDQAYELTRGCDDERWLGEIFMHSGIILRHTGKPRMAEEHLGKAAERARTEQDVLLEAETARELADVFRGEGRNRETLEALNQAHGLFSELKARRELADVHRRIARLEEAFLEIVREWGESIESKDFYTQGHCKRVADYAVRLAVRAGLDDASLIWFRMGALLHDLGKVDVPEEVLNKEGPLTDAEWDVLRKHPQTGVDLLGDLDFPWDIRPMILHHHERWDGAGYPHGLAGDEIPLAARILCVADVYDALTTDRSYRPGHSREIAVEIMSGDAGHVLDPRLFRLLEEILAEDAAAGAERDAGPGTRPAPQAA